MGSERSLLLSRIPLGEIPAERPSELAPRTLRLYWLGQAGFLIDAAPEHAPRPLRLLIDPYLSDSLAEKYRGKEFPISA
jgi:L-ascorbate metabolism protein UlaG (beta-lactamase superfamily)